MSYEIKFFHYSSDSVLISWPAIISVEISNDIDIFKSELSDDKKILEVIKGYNSLLVNFKESIKDYNLVCYFLNKTYRDKEKKESENKFIWEIPICYDLKFAKDMSLYSEKIGLSQEEIVKLHSSKIYFLHMYGFLPGFMYLGGMDNKLAIKRKEIPDRKILKGSVAIGGNQTGIYPSESPGGWYVIGNSPLNIFNISKLNEPVEIPVGSYIKFISVSPDQYYQIQNEIKKGEYEIIKKKYNG